MDPFAGLSASERALLRAQALPTAVTPMAATLTKERFSDPGWVYERKLDGVRCIAIRAEDGTTRLLTRNALSLDGRFPSIRAAVSAAGAADLVVDGEVVAFEGGRTSFARLQANLARPARAYLYLFDLLHLAGHDVTALPLRTRKRLLRRAIHFGDPLRYTPHRNRDGEALYAEACRRGWEGLIAKRADAPYVHRRSRDWLKFKCDASQELVIGGWTAPRGGRTHLGALLVGVWDHGVLRYAGKVGTGFTRATLGELASRLEPLRRPTSPFADAPRMRDASWAEPRLVAQVAFTEWTRDGRLRHPRFLGLREDKDPRSVVRE